MSKRIIMYPSDCTGNNFSLVEDEALYEYMIDWGLECSETGMLTVNQTLECLEDFNEGTIRVRVRK